MNCVWYSIFSYDTCVAYSDLHPLSEMCIIYWCIIGHALYWSLCLFNLSGYMLEVDDILKHFHYNHFFVTHQTWSKFNLKDWPENYKAILGSSIFIYVAIFCK